MEWKYKKTRYENLFYRCEAPGMWAFYDYEKFYDHYAWVGQKYKTELELLADMQRFAEERGYEPEINKKNKRAI